MLGSSSSRASAYRCVDVFTFTNGIERERLVMLALRTAHFDFVATNCGIAQRGKYALKLNDHMMQIIFLEQRRRLARQSLFCMYQLTGLTKHMCGAHKFVIDFSGDFAMRSSDS